MSDMSVQAVSQRGLLRSVIDLTWPILCAMLCQMVVGLTDFWTAGQLGSDVQASIGLVSQCQIMLLFIASATSTGAVAAVSQSFGADKPQRARRYIGLVLAVALCAGSVLGGIGLACRQSMLHLLSTPEAIMAPAMDFITAAMVAMPGHYGMLIGTALFRSARSVMMPFYVALLTCAINVAGDLGFGLGFWGLPACGIEGIAWSTTIAVTLGTIVIIIGLTRQGLLARDGWPCWRWTRVGGRYLVRVTLPALGTSLVWQAGYMLMFIITASLPTGSVTALAGLTGGLRIESVLFMPAVAFSMTASVLVGNALGAGDRAQARRTAISVCSFSCLAITGVVLVLWPFRAFLAGLLSADEAAVAATVVYLTYNFIAEPCCAISTVLSGVFNGAGASAYPMRAFLIAVWGVRLPLAYVFGHRIWGTCEGVFMAMMVSQFVQAFFLGYVLMRAPWRDHAMGAGRKPGSGEAIR